MPSLNSSLLWGIVIGLALAYAYSRWIHGRVTAAQGG